MAFVLAPDLPFDDWLIELDAQLKRSPGFFTGRPVVLDLARLNLAKPDVAGLMAQLQARGVRIIAVEGVETSWLGPGLAPLPGGSRPAGVIDLAERKAAEQPAEPEPDKPASLLLDQPVRSGQSVVFADGDLTILGHVASGAEVVAGGSIHIYGTLRGRAIAGSAGNPGARIFCSSLEAELLAIDGLYRTIDEIDDHLRGQPVQAWLEGNALVLAARP